MKKIFVEPALHRIELNLRENIAASEGGGNQEVNMGYYFTTTLFTCTIVTTGKTVGQVTEKEAEVCLVSSNTRSLRMFYPREDVLPHFKR